jgi:hypothetical protein
MMYFRRPVLDNLPTSKIEKAGTLVGYMAISAPRRMDLVLIPDRRMQSFVLPITTTPSLHTSAIISAVTLMILFLYSARERGEYLFALVLERILPNIDDQIFMVHRRSSFARH